MSIGLANVKEPVIRINAPKKPTSPANFRLSKDTKKLISKLRKATNNQTDEIIYNGLKAYEKLLILEQAKKIVTK